MCCAKIMILKKRVPFQYFKVEVCPNTLSLRVLVVGCFVLVFGFVGLVGFFFL